MFPAVLEVIISIVVVYFLLSTVVSFIKEIIAMMINSRGKILHKSLLHLFVENEKEEGLISKIYKSKYVHNLASKFSIVKNLNAKPSYIASENFTGALIDEIQKNGTKKAFAKNIDEFKKKLESLGDSFIKTKLQEIIIELEETQQANLTNLKKKVSEWFDSYMNSVTIIYKNYVTIWVFFISLFICFSMNIDSLVLIEYLFENKEKREVMVNFAENIDKNSYVINDSLKGDERLAEVKKVKELVLTDFNAFELPYGWEGKGKGRLNYEAIVLGNGNKASTWDGLKKIVGLFMTTVSLTLGAPFWFQMMVNLLNIRKSNNKSKR
jgi:ABC-type multidrug transport system fused ATPase/permease subunit